MDSVKFYYCFSHRLIFSHFAHRGTYGPSSMANCVLLVPIWSRVLRGAILGEQKAKEIPI